MYLTQMPLNPARRGSKFLLTSPHSMHAAVLAAFPPKVSNQTTGGRILWRVDRNQHELLLFIASPAKPDLTHVVEQAGWPTTSTWQTRDYDPFLGTLTVGQSFSFRLTANPVRQSRDPKYAGKRLGHVTALQQCDWLLERAKNHGFRIVPGVEEEPQVLISNRLTKEFVKDGHKVTLSTAQFDGRLEVTNVEHLRRSLANGIGRAKGYGCGLLTLSRS
jgi:CRISPR system Cascade subunit CasE